MFYPEYGGSMFVRNVCKFNHTVQCHTVEDIFIVMAVKPLNITKLVGLRDRFHSAHWRQETAASIFSVQEKSVLRRNFKGEVFVRTFLPNYTVPRHKRLQSANLHSTLYGARENVSACAFQWNQRSTWSTCLISLDSHKTGFSLPHMELQSEWPEVTSPSCCLALLNFHWQQICRSLAVCTVLIFHLNENSTEQSFFFSRRQHSLSFSEFPRLLRDQNVHCRLHESPYTGSCLEQDLRFDGDCTILSLGLWCCVVCWKFTNIPEEHVVSIFRVIGYCRWREATRSTQMSVSFYLSTWHHTSCSY